MFATNYKSEPKDFSIALSSTEQIYGINGNLKAVEIQNLDAALPLDVHFCINPWCLSFDGSNDVAAMDAAAADLATATAGSIQAGIKIDSAGSGVRTIFSVSDANAETALILRVTAADKIEATLIEAGTVQWTLLTDAAVAQDEWMKVKLVHDGVEAKIFIDGNTPGQAFTVSTTLTAWLSALTGLDTCNIGALDYNSAGNANFFDGFIDFLIVKNGEGVSATLALEYAIDEGTGTTLDDASANANNGTVSSATWALRNPGMRLSAAYAREWTYETEPDIRLGCWLTNTDAGAAVAGRYKHSLRQG